MSTPMHEHPHVEKMERELDAVDELHHALELEFGPDPEDRSRAAVDTRVDYLLAAIGAAERETADNATVAERRMAMIAAWRDGENASLERRVQWLRHKVQLLTLSYDYGNKKSRSLPHGSFGMRKSRDTVEILDPVKALDFAKAKDIPFEVREYVNKTPLIEYMQSTGTVPEFPEHAGVEFIPGRDEFFVRPNAGRVV